MSHTAKLDAAGKGYRYAFDHRTPHLILLPPSEALGPNRTQATDEQIEEWIDRRVANGGGTRAEIEAQLESRRADVASGYEDRIHAKAGK